MKLCTISGSRADFFILKNLILKIQHDKKILQSLIVAGSHTSKIFGYTIKDIKKNKIKIRSIFNFHFKGDRPEDILNYLALGIKKFSNIFTKIKPDLILLLGDRYEILAAALSAYILKIPIVHLYGGEKTKGSLDDNIRHSITKFSSVHLVATKSYLKRVRQLGENKKLIFNVGSLGVEAIKKCKIYNKDYLENKLKIKFNRKNVLMTFHPETNKSKQENISNLKILLNCLKKLKDTSIIITMPGADHYYRSIQLELQRFKNKNTYQFKSLGHDYYFSICKIVDFMIGNSSSGIIEMPTFKRGTINLGERQFGRVQAKSIINVEFNEDKIMNAISKIYSKRFENKIKKINNPY
jgi:UDP-hydrolysing UDP-N-acetyl-D-glucosamine 2-epimerase